MAAQGIGCYQVQVIKTLGKNSTGVSMQFRHHVTQQTKAILTAQNESSLLPEESVPVEEKVALGQAFLIQEYSIKCSIFKIHSYIIDVI